MSISNDEIKTPRVCSSTIEKLTERFRHLSAYEDGYCFMSPIAQNHFKQALGFLALAEQAMDLASLHEARERGNKELGR